MDNTYHQDLQTLGKRRRRTAQICQCYILEYSILRGVEYELKVSYIFHTMLSLHWVPKGEDDFYLHTLRITD